MEIEGSWIVSTGPQNIPQGAPAQSGDRLAAIDIGTNTILLLVAEKRPDGQIVALDDRETIVRLGQGVEASGRISGEALERAVSTLRQYVELAKAYGVSGILVTGTSALRDAANRDWIVEQIRVRVGLSVRILTGEEEARLAYRGALTNKSWIRGRVLMVDVGGGSTEFVVGQGRHVETCHSVDMGSVRLTERYLKHDPVTEAEIRRATAAIRSILAESVDWLKHLQVDAVLGVAGTVTTLQAMELGLSKYDGRKVDGQRLSAQAITRWVDRLRRLSVAERARIPGLRPERADVILAGALILEHVLEILDQEEMIVSDRGLRFGIVDQAWEEGRVAVTREGS